MPWPRQPRPIYDLLKNGAEKGDQYIEVHENDLNGGLKGGTINDGTFVIERRESAISTKRLREDGHGISTMGVEDARAKTLRRWR